MYTKKQILEIDATKRGLIGVYYNCSDGDIYVGVIGGRLRLTENASNVIINNNTTTSPQTVTEEVENLLEEANSVNLQLQSESVDGYTVLSYDSGGNVVKKIVYLDSSLSVTIFVVDYEYDGDDLVSITINRVADNFTYKKILTYDGSGNLINKNTINV